MVELAEKALSRDVKISQSAKHKQDVILTASLPVHEGASMLIELENSGNNFRVGTKITGIIRLDL